MRASTNEFLSGLRFQGSLDVMHLTVHSSIARCQSIILQAFSWIHEENGVLMHYICQSYPSKVANSAALSTLVEPLQNSTVREKDLTVNSVISTVNDDVIVFVMPADSHGRISRYQTRYSHPTTFDNSELSLHRRTGWFCGLKWNKRCTRGVKDIMIEVIMF